MTFILLSIVVIFLIFILAYFDFREKQKYLKKLGNVECSFLPILGSVLRFFPNGLRYFSDWLSSEESSRILWVLSVPIFYTRRPEELQIIFLNKNSLAKSIGYSFLEPIKYSVACTSVESWRPNRRQLNKCFKQKQILDFIPQYDKYAKIGMDKLLPKMNAEDVNEIFNVQILNAFFGTLGGSGTDDVQSIIKININDKMHFFSEIAIKRFLSPWLYPNFVFIRSEHGKQYKECLEQIRDINRMFLERKKRDMENNSKLDVTNDLLNILVHNFKPEEIDSDMSLFAAGAVHTSGSVVTTVLLLLGIHQNVQEKVYQEIVNVVGDDEAIETEHLTKLKFTQMVINEAMRLFPPLQLVARKATDDIDLGGGRSIPKGTEIMVSIKNIHTDKKLWKEPLKFIPERFSQEEVEKRHPCCYLPFSYGPRNCIAHKFAETIIKVFVANIVRKYRISSSCKEMSDIMVPKAVLFQFSEDIDVEFEKR